VFGVSLFENVMNSSYFLMSRSITFYLNGEKIELSAREANPRMTLLEVRARNNGQWHSF
jgi:hypothetical protein